MKQLLFVSLLIVLFSYSIDAQAADKYVRKGAAGSGTSWSDAYGDLNNVSWTGMSGYTLWVAAGSYTGGLPYLTVSNITVKRATTTEHGTDTGWSNSYDGQVTVDPSGQFLLISTSGNGLTFDGVGNNPWKFRIVGISGSGGMLKNEGADNVTLRNVEFDGNSENPSATAGPEDGLRWMGGSNAIIEYCYIHDYRQSGDEHQDGVQAPAATDITFRYNIFKNNGQHLFLGDCEWGSRYVNGVSIHHNVFYNEAGIGHGSYNTIVFKGLQSSATHPTKIDDNTFAVRTSEHSGTDPRLAVSDSAGCNDSTYRYVRNNIFYDSSPGSAAGSTHNNNAYYNTTALTEAGRVTADPLFTNYAGHVLTLQEGSPCRGAGVNLGYTSNSTPDMGAYENSSVVVSPSSQPSAPLNLRVQ